MPSSPDALDALVALKAALSGLSGVLPRRAVALADGTLADRAADPSRPEIAAVSVACEILRRAAREPVHPRHTPHLLAHCLETNDAGAWRAVLDDATTRDLDLAATAVFWADADHLARLVDCLVDATSGLHMYLVVRVAAHALGCTVPTAREHVGRAIHRRFQDLVRALGRRVRDVSPDMRATVVKTLGRLMTWCDIPAPTLAGMLDAAVRSAPDDVLRLFTYAPVRDLVIHAPDLVERVLGRAERAHQVARYPSFALLAVMTPDQLQPFRERLQRLVHRTLETAAAQGTVDANLALACGVLAKAAAPTKTLDASLAHALCCMSLENLQAPDA